MLVCNGPSLNGMDLSPLRDEIVFGLNKIHLGLTRFGFMPRYVAAVNDKVIAQAAAELAALPAVKFLSDRSRDLLPAGPLTFLLDTTSVPLRFSTDIACGVREGHTVTFVALQILYFMGVGEVVIIGMDHRFASSGPPDAELHMVGADPNHFSPAYFAGQDWQAPNLAASEAAYAEARRIFAADGRRILDATEGGACAVFEKVEYGAIFPAARPFRSTS